MIVAQSSYATIHLATDLDSQIQPLIAGILQFLTHISYKKPVRKANKRQGSCLLGKLGMKYNYMLGSFVIYY